MGIFKRIKDMITANINEMLDKIEDPEQAIDQMIREMEESILELRKQTAAAIIRVINQRHNTSITAKTATRYVREGMIGQSPLKRGPVGDIPKAGYTALKGAFVSYLKLEQAESKKQ